MVVLGLMGTTLDQSKRSDRWSGWRPTISVCSQPDLIVSRFELLHGTSHASLGLANHLCKDIAAISPETKVVLHPIDFEDPWDFEEVYETLYRFARSYPFDTEKEDYLIHITTGTHVAQICLFLLTESRHLPGRLLQSSPGREKASLGEIKVIDLDLSKYDRIASRFRQEQREATSFLKGGIETRNTKFNQLIDRIERVAIATQDPILLMGPTGAGKSKLARRIYDLKQARKAVKGSFVDVNCATLRGEGAMSALFGHTRGAFTGAIQERPGLLRTANRGVLFLDEIGELGLDEQAMLLRALEEKTFLPLGSDKEAHSDFQLIAGTNRDLFAEVSNGKFREDLLARINLWTFTLPGLHERPEDIEPNLQFELDQYAERTGYQVTFQQEAKRAFLRFALAPSSKWKGNFRDLNAAVARMATLSAGGRISLEIVEEEIQRLQLSWGETKTPTLLQQLVTPEQLAELDEFDRIQLEQILLVCKECRTLSEAGRKLYGNSRNRKSTANDADRLRKYLARFDLSWRAVAETFR